MEEKSGNKKSNLERVKDWIAQDGLEVSGMVVKEMKSRCCPFHFCEKSKLLERWQPVEEGEIFVEVNPDTSKRTLRKHYKKDIVPFLIGVQKPKTTKLMGTIRKSRLGGEMPFGLRLDIKLENGNGVICVLPLIDAMCQFCRAAHVEYIDELVGKTVECVSEGDGGAGCEILECKIVN